jgi:uncharacterized protein
MNSSSKIEAKAEVKAEIEEEQIAIDYLQAHPDFFTHHPMLLSTIDIPHESGAAVSLIERQVGILREQNNQQKKQLSVLLEIARENEQSNQKMQNLTLSLLDCKELPACDLILKKILCEDFSVDAVALKLFQAPLNPLLVIPGNLVTEKGSPLKNGLEKILNTRKPMCGVFNKLPLDELFDDQYQSISSLAILPLYIEKNNCFGALVMGSNNIRRFNADMGTLFLERLSETLSHIINRFL